MTVPQGVHTYQQTSIRTADRRQVVVLLYEGIIKNLNIAAQAIETGDIATRTAKINKSLEIIQFMSAALDFDRGGEIATNLSRLYDYCRDTITMANIKTEVAPLREVVELFRVVLEGWHHIGANAPIPDDASVEEPAQAASQSPLGAPVAPFASVASHPPISPDAPPRQKLPPHSPAPVPVSASTPPVMPVPKGYAAGGKGKRSRAIVG